MERHGIQQTGFTLIELVMVVIILGIVGFGISKFVGTGTQIYVDVTERDALLSDSRFVVERLNRELRSALPNSARVAGNSTRQCLEFVPVIWSTHYFDIPVAPEASSNNIEVVAHATNYVYLPGHQVVVYPTQTSDVYDGNAGHRYALSGQPNPPVDGKSTLSLTAAVQFTTDSPGSRLYVVEQPVSYCVEGGQINRFAGYGFNTVQNTALAGGVLMAENLSNLLSANAGLAIGDPFRVVQATLQRNSAIITMLQFESGGERVTFNNEVHQPNVP